jgi:membrane protein DedA with SNARE-associated domain
MIESAIVFIEANVAYGPYVVFGLLLLAGLCLPVSEDVMMFISATLAYNYPDYFFPYLIAIFSGAYISDLMAFTIGCIAGKKLWNIKFIAKTIPYEKVELVEDYYKKYGIITLILGRFIPFGVRNALFIAAGIGRMNPIRFALSDLLACTISTSIYFPLYYFFGQKMVDIVRKSNIVIFSVAIVVVLFFVFKHKKNKRKETTT